MAPRITARETRNSDNACTVVTEGVMVLKSRSKSGSMQAFMCQQLRQVVAVANLISGALRPDAVSLRCVQFALLRIFNGRSRRMAAMRRTDSRFGLRRLQCRKGVEGRQPAAVWDDQIPGAVSAISGAWLHLLKRSGQNTSSHQYRRRSVRVL